MAMAAAASHKPLRLEEMPKKCINLRRRPDRWHDFSTQPGAAAFGTIDRYEAVDAQHLDISKDPNVSVQVLYNIQNNERRSHHEIVSKGSIACYYSHTNLWKWLVNESDAQALCVMEDDLKLDPDSYQKLQELLQDPAVVTGDWDILNPGAFVAAKTPISDTMSIYNRSFLFHCYIITRKGAERLLKTAFPIQMHIDHYASFCASVGKIKIIGPTKRLLFQRDDKSDNRTDFKCNACNVPTIENPKHGRYIRNYRARMYEIEESVLVISALLVGLYIWKKHTS
jgi:GR25 family glycosyltransferase involved in LPS biosynthesis